MGRYYIHLVQDQQKSIKSGVLLDNLTVKGILKSDEIGERHLQDFISKRIKVNKNDAVVSLRQLKTRN